MARGDEEDSDAPAPARKRLAKVEEAEVRIDADACTPLPATVPLETVMGNTVASLPLRSKRVRRQWSRVFHSKPCKDVIQDAFWWTVCTHCKRGPHAEVQAERLLDRVSSNFATLLLTLPQRLRDTFLSHFFDALAQVVFNGLWFGFPGSRKLFTDGLKRRIINDCAEWTQGLRPHTVSHRHWMITDTAHGAAAGRHSRARQGLGPTIFEERGGGAADGSLSGATGGGASASGRKNRLLLHTRSKGAARERPHSMSLYHPVVRERVTYELSHSGLLKRYLTRSREQAEQEDNEQRQRVAAARRAAQRRVRSARRAAASRFMRPPIDVAQPYDVAETTPASAVPLSRSTRPTVAVGGGLPLPSPLPHAAHARRPRRPFSTGSIRPRLRPPVSPFVARVTLTEDVGTPIVGHGGTRRPQRHAGRRALPHIGPNTPTTFLELVDKSETMRRIVKDDYSAGQTLAAREIAVARQLASTEQSQIRQRRTEALSGDVHEFSNYLVSMWALAEVKNKRKRTQKVGTQ